MYIGDSSARPFIGIFVICFLLSYLSLFSYLLWSLTSFCRYSCTYLMLELLYIWRLFPVLRLSVRTWGDLRLAYVRHHSAPYLWDRGATQWHQSLLEVEMQGSILISPDQLVRRFSQGRNPSLNGKLATRKSSDEHGFFVAVTSLKKIGEGRIWDLTGDVPFPWSSNVPCSLWSERICDLTGASCLIMSWCVSRTARICLAFV